MPGTTRTPSGVPAAIAAGTAVDRVVIGERERGDADGGRAGNESARDRASPSEAVECAWSSITSRAPYRAGRRTIRPVAERRTGTILRLPDDARPPLRRLRERRRAQAEGDDFTVDDRALRFLQPAQRGCAGGPLAEARDVDSPAIGYYGQGDSIDVDYRRADGTIGVVVRPAGRAGRMRFEPLVDLPDEQRAGRARVRLQRRPPAGARRRRADAADLDGAASRWPLGQLDGRLCLAYELADDHEPGDGPRAAARCARSGAASRRAAVDARRPRAADASPGTATTRSAGAAARPPSTSPGERARGCPNCGLAAYPRLAPAVIVLIERDGAALLCHGVRFPGQDVLVPGRIRRAGRVARGVRAPRDPRGGRDRGHATSSTPARSRGRSRTR